MRGRLAKLLSVAAVCGLFLASPALAIQYGGIGGSPAYPDATNPRTKSIFVHTLNPGESKQDGVQVINNTAETKTLLVYPTDSLVATGGSFACKQLAEPKQEVGAWITLKQAEVTLAPGTNTIVNFTIKLPKQVDVGEHNGCLIVQEKKTTSATSGAALSLRTGLRIAITVPGKIVRSLEIAGFEVEKSNKSTYILKPSVKNTGNVSIDTNILVRANYFFGGKPIFENTGKFPVLRGETSSWNFEMKKPFWGGWYRASMEAKYDEDSSAKLGVDNQQSMQVLQWPAIVFWVNPEPQAAAIEIFIILLLLGGLYLLVRRFQKRRDVANNWVEKEVDAGDTLHSIADHYGVSWEEIAKANHLKPPYDLKPKQKIKVPPRSKA